MHSAHKVLKVVFTGALACSSSPSTSVDPSPRADAGTGPEREGGVSSSPDAAAPSGACSALDPFGPPQRVPGIDLPVGLASLSADERTIAFVGPFDDDDSVFGATRASATDPFAPAGLEIEADGGEPLTASSSFALSADGLQLYKAATLVPDALSRPDRTARFGLPTPVKGLPTGSYPQHMPNETSFYYSECTGEADECLVFRATKTGPDTFVSPVRVTPLGLDVDTLAVTADEKTMYFTTYEPDDEVPVPVQVATRTDLASEFGPGTTVSGPASARRGVVFVSPNGCRLYFTEEVADDAGDLQPYLFVQEKTPSAP